MRNISIKELTDWILVNRRGEAFKGYAPNKISNEIKSSIASNVFAFNYDKHECITGIVCGEKLEDGHYIIIHDILTIEKGTMKKFMQFYLSLYPDWPIIAKRNGKLTTYYNPTKLERKMK